MMKQLWIVLAAALGAVGGASCSECWNAADYGITPKTKDCTPALEKLLQKARECKEGVQIAFPAGTYHFYPDKAPVHELYVSNHDQPLRHKVGIALVGVEDLELCAKAARFVFHGDMLPVLIQDSRKVKCRGFSISYATPFSAEGKIVSANATHTTLEFPPGVNPPWCVENSRFIINGENGPHQADCSIVFREDGMIAPTGRGGDLEWKIPAVKIAGNCVRFSWNALERGYKIGDTVVLRNSTRPHPAMVLYRASDTVLRDVVFHDSQGMAMVAQRSENIRIHGGGCICRKGRKHSVSADACHFSNCKGEIVVEDALFEGMMDDAINVHATSLRITRISEDRRTVRLCYVHRQAYGFETFQAGERVRFIKAATLENVAQTIRVESVETPDPKQVVLSLEEPAPMELTEGDAVENADWHPSVVFRRNVVRNNRARGALFTTPKRVLVEDNKFIRSSGSAILLAGDAAGWYESGACEDVIIRNNLFDHNLTCLYQFTHGIISICPEVKKPGEQAVRYHRNIRIEKNSFRTHRVPLLYAISADDVIFRDNKVKYDGLYPAMSDGKPYIIEHCGRMDLQ